MHEVLVNRLGGLSLPRKSVVRLTDHPDMTLDVYLGRKKQQQNNNNMFCCWTLCFEMDFISLKLSFRPSTANYVCLNCNMYIIFLNKYCLNQYVLYNLAQIYIEVKKSVVKHPTK